MPIERYSRSKIVWNRIGTDHSNTEFSGYRASVSDDGTEEYNWLVRQLTTGKLIDSGTGIGTQRRAEICCEVVIRNLTGGRKFNPARTQANPF